MGSIDDEDEAAAGGKDEAAEKLNDDEGKAGGAAAASEARGAARPLPPRSVSLSSSWSSSKSSRFTTNEPSAAERETRADASNSK